MSESKKSRPYEVGYGKPPTKNQFKPGKSGNPCGRRARKLDLTTRIGKKLASKRLVVISGNRVNLSIEDILLERLIERAAKGDVKALFFLLSESTKYRAAQEQAKTPARRIYSKQDLAKMTNQERTDLYMKTLRSMNGQPPLSQDEDGE